MDFIRNNKDFKEALGGFAIAFSELEFGLVYLCTLTEFDPRNKGKYVSKYLGFSFEQKVKQLSDYVDEHLIEVKPVWDKIKVEIGQLNRERRFLIYGFLSYSFPGEAIAAYVKDSGQAKPIQQSTNEIKKCNTFKKQRN